MDTPCERCATFIEYEKHHFRTDKNPTNDRRLILIDRWRKGEIEIMNGGEVFSAALRAINREKEENQEKAEDEIGKKFGMFNPFFILNDKMGATNILIRIEFERLEAEAAQQRLFDLARALPDVVEWTEKQHFDF